MRGIVGIFSIMIILFAGIMILFPPLGLTLGVTISLLVIIYNIHISTIRLLLDEEKLTKSSIFYVKEIMLEDLEKIEKIKILGLFDQSPIAIRYVTFRTKSGIERINTLGFDFDEVLSILNQIEEQL